MLEPGSRIQNWYSGLGLRQPDAVPVMVTAVPTSAVADGEVLKVTATQAVPEASVYVIVV